MTTNEPEEIRIQTRFFKFAAKKWGNPAGMPILGLHGWLDNAATFDRLAPLLTDYCFVSLDLAGHGLSDHRPEGMKYHYMDYLDDTAAVADALGWDSFTLLGHSLGGGIAAIFAGTFPQRVRSLILIEALGPRTFDVNDSPVFLARSIQQLKQHARKKAPVYKDFESIVSARVKVSTIDEEAVQLLVNRSVRKTASGFTWQSDPRLKITSPSYNTEEQVRSFLKQISCPTLLITGREGSAETVKNLADRRAFVPQLQHQTVTGGHHLHLDNPGETGRLINDFLNRN